MNEDDYIKITKEKLNNNSKEIIKDGLISSWFIDGRIQLGVWNLKHDYLLKDYISYYSGGTILYSGIFKNGIDTQENKTLVIPYNELPDIINITISVDCHMWIY